MGKLMGPARKEQSSFMAKRKQQPTRKSSRARKPTEPTEDHQALLKCLRKWLGEAKALRRGASGGQVWSGSQDFSKAEWSTMTWEIMASLRLPLPPPGTFHPPTPAAASETSAQLSQPKEPPRPRQPHRP